MNRLLVTEIFGPTIQGEGFAAGTFCLFIRLALCNQRCTWCDSAYTWAFTDGLAEKHIDKKRYDKLIEMHPMTVNEVLAALQRLWPINKKPCLIVITGGEPMIQQELLLPLMQKLDEYGCDTHIETAGTIVPKGMFSSYVSRFNVSPKLANSGNPLSRRFKVGALQFFSECPWATFKFVISDASDLEEVDRIVEQFEIPLPRVQIMPEGVDTGTILDTAYAIEEEVLKRGYGLSLRNHILIYGNKRGT